MAQGQVSAADIQAVSECAVGAAQLLAKLGYDVSEPADQTAAGLGVAERFQHLVRSGRRLVGQRAAPGLPPALEIYCFETTVLTAELRQAVVAAFRNKPAQVLLLMATRDFVQLDFVLIEKSIAQSAAGGQVSVSHQLFSVDRRHPSRVHLRVVNRMANIAPDPYAQFDRIRDAFRLAEWSEDEFNNRNLFSDYFLKNRLPQQSQFPVWHGDFKPAYKQLAGIYQAAGQLRSLDSQAYLDQFILPLLSGLGFSPTAGGSASGHADYLLKPLPTLQDAAPVAALLVYPWDRPLDRKDDLNRPRAEDVPGIRIVKVLEEQKLQWAILTNGKDWRLYCAQAHSRATNYYEIDLADALEHDDLIAFRYFYLFFRAEAFLPSKAAGPGFLEQLRDGSAAFAKELGDRLRRHIFDQVFPYLAQGFVDNRKLQLGEKTAAGDEFLAQTYDATLTLLYRLLFLLYAESLDLLPVHEPAYAVLSLSRLKEQIKVAAGGNADLVEDRLKARYTKSDTGLYDGLVQLFAIIDKGSQEHNVPVYNGGLFNSAPPAADTSHEADTSRFLTKHKVPDFYLARALDMLARSEDAKSGELVFVDYKSLGVRQLGSVYEGLLMYHVVIPRDDWEKGYQRAGLKVALVPSNKDRKSTGSYFTPQHIVKYIVTQTVGPLLEDKFAAIAPKLRAAQREYHEQRKYEADRQLAPILRKAEEIVFKKHADLVHELLDIKVVDVSMGSGHFVVETVDFITDRVLEFLAGFPWNPVQVFVDRRVRRPIIDSLEAQGVKINEQRLTDVNLIKRLVMKRCVYGVDINPMAVELAKVSVWLDSFTVGAPLSFMDHHFKCGNSLIGSSIADLKKLADERGGLWSIPMEPLERATKNMELIADLSDVTLTEVNQSASTYQKVLAGVKGYRVLLDCITAEHFGVAGASALVTQGHDLNLEHWDETVAKLPEKEKKWVEQSTKISGMRRFFHWDVDFPDVFFASRRPPDRRKFDAVVGNPPYDELSEFEAGMSLPEKTYLDETPHYTPAKGGRQNIFRYFVVRAVQLIHPLGRQSFIVPMAILTDGFTRPLRKWLLSKVGLGVVEAFPQKDDPKHRVFEEAKISTCLFVTNGKPNKSIKVRTHLGATIDEKSPTVQLSLDIINSIDPAGWSIPVGSDGNELLLMAKLVSGPRVSTARNMGDFAPGELMMNANFDPRYLSKPGKGVEVLRGSHIYRYGILAEARQGERIFVDLDRLLLDAKPESKIHRATRPRLVFQRGAAIDNYRRLIAAWLDEKRPCVDTASHCIPGAASGWTILALFNSAVLEWRFNFTSSNNHINSYEVESLPIPIFQSEGRDFSRGAGRGDRRVLELGDIWDKQAVHDIVSAADVTMSQKRVNEQGWPAEIHDALGGLGNVITRTCQRTDRASSEMTQQLSRVAEAQDAADWPGATKLLAVEYLGWDARYPTWNADESTLNDGRRFPNGVAPPLGGNGPGDIPWDLIAQVYPSYPLPDIDESSWESAAWAEFCDLLRKNKTKIGNTRIKADLTGSGAVVASTGPMKKLQEMFLKCHREVRQNRAKAAELDFLIDRIVFRLFDLTLDEQKLILSRVGPGRPLPPRRGKKAKAAEVQEQGLF